MAQGHVHGHLVTVEVGVERRTNERVQLDRLALDQFGLEGLDRPRRCSVGARFSMTGWPFRIFSGYPTPRASFLSTSFFAALHRFHDTALDEFADDERLEQLSGHVLRQTALMQFQFRAYHDNRTACSPHVYRAGSDGNGLACLSANHSRTSARVAFAFTALLLRLLSNS
jgi:hypothetical protein